MSTTVCPFFRMLKEEDKAEALMRLVSRFREGSLEEESVFLVDPASFRKVPNSPFAYWVGDAIRELFRTLPPFESEGRTVKQGLATADDFRFVRAWWEVPGERRLDAARGPDWRQDLKAFQDWCRRRTHEGKYWVPFAKGGEYSPYYADIHLVLNWRNEGEEIKNLIDAKSGRLLSRPQNTDFYFRPGLTWSDRTTSLFSARIWPAGGVFSVKGSAGFFDPHEWYALAIMNSSVFNMLISLLVGASDAAARSYQVGTIGSVPLAVPKNGKELNGAAGSVCAIVECLRKISSGSDTDRGCYSACFLGLSGSVQDITKNLAGLKEGLERIIASSYGIKDPRLLSPFVGKIQVESTEKSADQVLVECIGIAFGRWDIRMATSCEFVLAPATPFHPLPLCPPATLVSPDGLPATSGHIVSEEWLRARPNASALPPSGSVKRPTIPDNEYPLQVSWNGILVDDPGHPADIVARVRKVLDLLWKDRAFSVEQECCTGLGVSDLREYLRKPAGFFQDHLARYSKSRRKAPIYWPLSTKSGSYTLWVYYPRLTEGTLYDCLNNYLAPKLEQTGKELTAVRVKLREKADAELRKRHEELVKLEGELSELRAELLHVAALPYKPDLDDGVVICAAPLRKLFRLGKWQKELETNWAALEAGNYDWAHLSYAIWPKRVEEKCRMDRALAIAHGLEHLCTVQVFSKRASNNSATGEDDDQPELEEDEE
jgi:hypothetical protein